MSEYVAVQYPEVTANKLANEICAVIDSTSNPYYKVNEVRKILMKNNLYADETRQQPKSNCDGE